MPSPCELLEWDSEHFGFPIASVLESKLRQDTADELEEWCRDNDVRCLYFLADAEDAETSRVAAECGFRVVDLRITIRRSFEELSGLPFDGPDGMEVGEVDEAELGYLRSLAAESHRGTRFYFDGGFPPERCAALYEAWIERGFRDPGRSIRVAAIEGEPAGYQVVGPPAPDGTRRLELIAVDPRRQGRGIAPALVLSAMRLLESEGATETWTILSPRNVPSIRMHEKLGFLTEDVQVWHHKWYRGE
jgi:ribosomal protein S18 acetylase RimI-like enzyme